MKFYKNNLQNVIVNIGSLFICLCRYVYIIQINSFASSYFLNFNMLRFTPLHNMESKNCFLDKSRMDRTGNYDRFSPGPDATNAKNSLVILRNRTTDLVLKRVFFYPLNYGPI